MTIAKKIIIFSIIGFICAWVIFLMSVKKGACQINISPGMSFSADSSSLYFFDRDEGRVYKYNTHGKIVHTYVIKELGKDLQSK